MKRLLLVFLLLGLALPVNAFWGSTEEEKNICRNRAKGERNEFSAKQTYKYCLKNLKEERNLEQKNKRLEENDKRIEETKSKKRIKIYKKYCKEFMKKNNKYNNRLTWDPKLFPYGKNYYFGNMDIVLDQISEKLTKYDSIESTYFFKSRVKKNSGYSGINQDVHMSKCDEIFQ